MFAFELKTAKFVAGTIMNNRKQKDVTMIKTKTFKIEENVFSKQNAERIKSLSGNNITESLVAYICLRYDNDNSKSGLMDPRYFARLFDYGTDYLRMKNNNPFQKTNEPESFNSKKVNMRNRPDINEKKRFENNIENAFYILSKFHLLNVTNQEEYTVLDKFEVTQNATYGKIYYKYTLNDTFIDNLKNSRIKIDLASFNNLRKSGLTSLYFYLNLYSHILEQEEMEQNIKIELDFEELCEIGNVNTNLDKKYQKRDLNEAIKRIDRDTNLRLHVEWNRDRNNKKYIPIIVYPQSFKTKGKEETAKCLRILSGPTANEIEKRIKHSLQYLSTIKPGTTTNIGTVTEIENRYILATIPFNILVDTKENTDIGNLLSAIKALGNKTAEYNDTKGNTTIDYPFISAAINRKNKNVSFKIDNDIWKQIRELGSATSIFKN